LRLSGRFRTILVVAIFESMKRAFPP
jgi:hypothetical protein